MTRPANPELPKRTLIEAEKLLVAHGLDAMTMRSLSDRLGISPTAIYHYYPDRSAILSGVRQRATSRLLKRMGDIDDGNSPTERAMRFAQLFIEFGRNEKNLFSLIFNDAGPDKKKVFEELETLFSALAHPNDRSGKTHAAAAKAAISLLYGFTALAIEGIYSFDETEVRDCLFQQVGAHLLN